MQAPPLAPQASQTWFAQTPLQQLAKVVQAWPPATHWPWTQRSAPLQEWPFVQVATSQAQAPFSQLSPKAQADPPQPPSGEGPAQVPDSQVRPAQQSADAQLPPRTAQIPPSLAPASDAPASVDPWGVEAQPPTAKAMHAATANPLFMMAPSKAW